MIRVKDKGDLYIHQDPNWNVIGTTDLGGSVVEANVLTPYGQLTVNQETSYGDRDGDGDVDATDKGTPGSTCTGTVTGACRILHLDPALDSALPASRADRQAIVGFAHSAVSRVHGDYDSADATLFDALPQGLARHPGRTASGTDQPFAHQGLLFEPEISQYQNRARQYDPAKRRFLQRDPLALLRASFIPNLHYIDGMSLYGYVHESPLSLTDALGLAGDACMDACSTAHNAAKKRCDAIPWWPWCWGRKYACYACVQSSSNTCVACCTGGPDNPVTCPAPYARCR